jgi:hypothetical protein
VRLGPKVVFLGSDATVDEWRSLLRAMYADGGWFARQATFGSFLTENAKLAKSPNGQEALRRERSGDVFSRCKVEIQALWQLLRQAALSANSSTSVYNQVGGSALIDRKSVEEGCRGDAINFRIILYVAIWRP